MVLYRLLQILVVPLQIGRALWLALSRQESMADLRDRLIGFRSTGPALWLHGASVGELASARQIITALRAMAPDLRIIVTTDRATGRDRARSWGLEGVAVHLAPIDLGSLAGHLIRSTDVRALVTLENELWPARMAAFHAAQRPVILLSARVSDRSASSWARLPAVARAVLAPVALALPQNETTARHLQTLGVPAAAIGPIVQLKAGYTPTHLAPPAEFANWHRADTLLAASTHDGEETLMIDGFLAARQSRPDLRLVIAPRHTDRADSIETLVRSRGLTVARRSRSDAPEADVYLADTMGEMPIWYQLSGLCILGGSFVPKGGHTPYEPIAYGCPVLHGPHVENFAEDFAQLDAAQGARQVETASDLAEAILSHMDDTRMAERARLVVTGPDPRDIASRILAALDPDPQPR